MVPAHWMMRAAWTEENAFASGALHFACLRTDERRTLFMTEFEPILTGYGRDVTVTADQEEYTVEQPGLNYGDRIFNGDECSIFRNTATDRWLVLESQGPWHIIDARQLADLGTGKPVRSDTGVERAVLPGPLPDGLRGEDLAAVLDTLGTRELHPDLLEHGSPAYEFWSFEPRKGILEYAVVTDLPLPAEAVEFLTPYAASYKPITFEE